MSLEGDLNSNSHTCTDKFMTSDQKAAVSTISECEGYNLLFLLSFAVSAYLKAVSQIVEGVSSDPKKDHEKVWL